jgi:predicted nucleic acid-binding protein
MLLKGMVIDSERFAICQLTEYEIGNVLWKESQKGKVSDPARAAELFYEAIKDLPKIGVDSMPRVLLLAIDRKLTFYDASYSYIAEKERMILVTQDEELRRKTRNAIAVEGLELGSR